MSLLSTTWMATKAAIGAFRDVFSDPTHLVTATSERQAYFLMLWSYYKSNQFDDISQWAQYRERFVLYRNIRPIYNPTKRLVNFYVAQVYPGVLSEDGSKLPDGVPLAIPLSEDTPDAVKVGIAEFWRMSNWQSGNKLMVRYGAATGSCLVEVIDNVERGKVSAAVKWPGLVDELELDDVGNVKSYALEFEAWDEEDKSYIYRKEVDQESFRYFKNDIPFTPEGQPGPEVENLYGFVPAVWCKHIDEGADFGVPAISGSIAKIDELNGIASHTHDHIDKLIESPGIISSDGGIGKIGEEATRIKDAAKAASDEFSPAAQGSLRTLKRLLLKASKGASWVPLTGNLQPEQVIPSMEKLLGEIEQDFPELSMYQELRKMSQVTGPGAARMMGDVYSRVLEVSSNYDTQSIKLFQMALAIGGMRFAERAGGWVERTEQREKFSPFSLESYRKGQLDFDIMPRPLIPLTESDSIEMTGARLTNAVQAQKVLSEARVLEIAGISDKGEQKAEILLLEKERKAKAELIPPAAKPPNGDSQLIQ